MEPGKSYHLYSHANGFENLFQAEENYRYFLKRYEHFIPSVADTLAYFPIAIGMMPNHIHFLIRIKTEAEIESAFSNLQSKLNHQSNLQGFKNLGGLERGGLETEIEKRISQQFSNLFNGYTKAFNKMYNRRGSLFIPNFKREEITSDNYFTNIILYIHSNPVHHGFVKNIGDWPWSSYQLILNDTPTFIKGDEVLKWFGNRNEYVKIHQEAVTIKATPDNDFFKFK